MTQLSINVNKFALLRNSRGTDYPNLIEICKKCILYGANGITVHPRPDERHTKFADLKDIKNLLLDNNSKIEFNIEGYPSEFFIKKVLEVSPNQVTLVPDPPEAITSSFGWDCKTNKVFLEEVVKEFQKNNIRVSIFVSSSINTLENLEFIKPNRVELYTFDYAHNYKSMNHESIKPYKEVVNYIKKNFPIIDFNAGHDLNLENLNFFLNEITSIKEVSIGHAIVIDSINFGLENTIKKYLKIIKDVSR
ncbi:pyridoxine 5'-phosphate synthase [Alphaproteobacteria bacterium]|nr:pyridoxine 5'-phosphate synthase [Alphaproteobacteria bacterium]